ncbi:site-specific integrase [Brevundimonas sp.]|uniref:tyrosine-type recombinase/integrase n=1 Tax=Brevundimonas sp. TaxID=1871086 RepID=UPI0027314CC3|nr:site-specific integrase [Brevundimonas sp.]MDP1912114.1 site-specific integrase [Brevundimonas sp.]
MPIRTAGRLTKTLVDRAEPGSRTWDSEVPGFGLRVTAAGTKSFIFQFRSRTNEQGRMVIGRYPSMTVEQARKAAREHRVAVDQGGNPSRERQGARSAATLRDLATYYCDVYGLDKGLQEQTIKDARSLLNRFALPKFGVRKIAELKPGDIRAIHNEARKGAGRYQANRLRAVLSRMFTLAIQNEWRTDNPCRGVERFPEDQRWDYLSEQQVPALLRACDLHHDQHAANAVRLLLFTGARLREVLKAEWVQFDLDVGLWIKPSHHTKTKILHRLHLAPATVMLLQSMRGEGPPSKFLFPGRDGLKPRCDLKRPWAQLLKAADIGHHRRHDLRRTTASFMISTGSDLMTVGKALGQTQASTTQRYAQLFEDVQRAGVSRAVERMSSMGTKSAA